MNGIYSKPVNEDDTETKTNNAEDCNPSGGDAAGAGPELVVMGLFGPILKPHLGKKRAFFFFMLIVKIKSKKICVFVFVFDFDFDFGFVFVSVFF